MAILLLGLLLFIGTHSVRFVADDWRTRTIERVGAQPWRGVYSLLSIAGVALIVWGYGMTRASPELWSPPAALRPVTTVLTLVSFYLIAAAFTPRTRVREKIWHPMIAGTKLWAFAHLLSNGRAGDLVLFGVFLAWAVVAFAVNRRRDRAAGKTYPPGSVANDVKALAIGTAVWAVFGFWAHRWMTGVPVFS